MIRALTLLAAAIWLTGCGIPYHREMLGKSIAEFSQPLRENNGDRIWISNMADSGCDSHGALCGGGGLSLGGGGGGGLFGGFGGGGGGHDGLAYEVFANFITQKRKGKVVEPHRHNYATDLGVTTHVTQETVSETAAGTKKTSHQSCEDLCLLDEAKKRKADKILVYSILEMKDEEMKIHLRFSDVRSGLVEFSRSLHVRRGTVTDISF
jgi:hypothetical protein